MRKQRILLVEPYYGGSHKQFLDGLTTFVPADYVILSLPARKWKMRMQLAAPWFVGKIREMNERDRFFDIVLFSTFLDVAVFKALVIGLRGWNDQCRYFTYFHENQFHYPGYLSKRTNHQFTAINFTTGLVSDRLAFNSHYNRTTFFGECRKYLEKAVDIQLEAELQNLSEKSVVLYPGLDFTMVDRLEREKKTSEDQLIIWNHRWEHDKNPEEFFKVLYRLLDERVGFRVAVLGESFRKQPDCFKQAEERLEENIRYFGYIENKEQYHGLLREGDIVVSTALHEFFGISVLEAVRAGCRPLLPDRLVYPELFGREYLYGEGCLFENLKELLINRTSMTKKMSVQLTDPFDWRSLGASYRDWFNS